MISHPLVVLLLLPLGAVAAIALCILILLIGLALGCAGWWTIRRAAETVLGPAHDL